FRADITCPGTLLRRLLIEAHALSLVQLFKSTCFNRTAVEKPFLPAIIPDEAEPTIAYQSFDSSVSHVQNLRQSHLEAALSSESSSVPSGKPSSQAGPLLEESAGRGLKLEHTAGNGPGKGRV